MPDLIVTRLLGKPGLCFLLRALRQSLWWVGVNIFSSPASAGIPVLFLVAFLLVIQYMSASDSDLSLATHLPDAVASFQALKAG